MFKNCFVSFVASRAIFTIEGGRATVGTTFLSLKAAIPRVCNLLLTSIEKEISVTELRTDFSKGKVKSPLNGLLTKEGVYRMLAVKEFQCIDMVLTLICGLVDKATGYTEDVERTNMNTMYSELLLELYFKS